MADENALVKEARTARTDSLFEPIEIRWVCVANRIMTSIDGPRRSPTG
jgi:hypothetical protein